MSGFEGEAIPTELKERDQWVCWAEEIRNDKPTKVPKRPDNSGRNAKSSDMESWGSFEDAAETAEREGWGIGFMFSDADPYLGVDLDGCRDENGGPADWLPSIDEFVRETHIEASPSGDGLHIIFEDARIPEWWTNQKEGEGKTERGVEVYDSGRFFTVTGDPIVHESVPVTDAGDLEGWLLEAWGVFNDELPSAFQSPATGEGRDDSADIGVFDVISRSQNPPGERSEHPFHGSDTGANFLANDDNETWRCWRHSCTGNADHLLGIEQGVIECGEWTNGGLDSQTWREIYDAGREAGYDIPDPKSGTQPATDGSEIVEGQESADPHEVPTPEGFGLSIRDGGYGKTTYRNDEEYWDEYTNFQLETNSYATDPDDPRDKRVDMTVHPRHGESYDVVVSPTVFNEPRNFKAEVVTGLSTVFSGGGDVLNTLRQFVGTQDAPSRIGTYQMGLHDHEWVTPQGVLTADGWEDDPDHVHVAREISAERKWSLSPDDGHDYDPGTVREIVETLPQTREFERFLPVLGWFYAAPLKPLIKQWSGQFNLLSVIGETGSGKTATLSALWRAFGMEGDPMTADDTKFVIMTTLASSCAVPMWFDEYKPSDMRAYEVDQFWNEVRKTTRGGVSSRGNADGSTDEYHLDAPVVVSGEERVHGSAEERRGIFTTFREGATDPGSASSRAFARLTGGSAKRGDGIEYYEGMDLGQHALAYYQFVLSADPDQLNQMWRNCAQDVSELLVENGIEGLEDLVEQGLQTIQFGLRIYQWFGSQVDAETPISDEDIERAILYVATNVVGGVNRKSHLDVFLEVAARAARHGYVEEGQHFKFVNEDAPHEELRFNLSTTFDKVARYAREHEVAEDLLNSADDYRERIADAEGSGYISHASIPTSGLNRCVGINRTEAEESLEGFQKGMFVDVETDETGSGATPLQRLTPGYADVTVRCVASATDTPGALAETGTLSDATGVVDYVVWERAEPVDLEEDKAYYIKNANVGRDNDGALQLELNRKVCEIQPIGDGVGNLSHADSGNNEQVDAASDGSETQYGQAKPRMKELLKEHEPCPKPEWMAKAQQAGIEHEAAEGAFDSLKAQGLVMETDGEWVVT